MRGLFLLMVVLVSCGDLAGGDSAGAATDCDAVGDHMENICGLFAVVWAERTRYECETFGMSMSDRRCVVRSTTCDETSLGACNVHDRTWSCASTDEGECPPGLMCDVGRAPDSECVACIGDQHCETGRFCLDGWCVDDTPDHRTLQDLTGAP